MNCYQSIAIIAFCYAVVVTYSSSQYKGVRWHNRYKKWVATVCCNNKQFHGGNYLNELDAAKRVNQLCDELMIEIKNPEVDHAKLPPRNQTVTCSSSKYKGVVWHKQHKKWMTTVCWNSKQFSGGEYRDELDAAKRVNQLCDELEIKRKNPEVDTVLKPKVINSTSSQYIGVTETNKIKKWRTVVHCNKKKYEGGYYYDEQDAAKRVNQLCDELGIERKNPEVDAMPKSNTI